MRERDLQMRCLVVYYSLTGNTRKVAHDLAKALGADVLEVRSPRYRRGPISFLRGVIDSRRGRTPPIEAAKTTPETYDLVLAAAPTWAWRAAPPIRAWLGQHRGRIKRAAFVLTCGGACPPSALKEMAELAGAAPEASLVLKAREIKGRAQPPPALAALVKTLKTKART